MGAAVELMRPDRETPRVAPDAASAQASLVDALAGVLRDAGYRVRQLETHISYVVLTGTLAYKIKKRVDLGFLDFTSLDARRFYCEEEIRLNRRLAPRLYLRVVPITGTPAHPTLGGSGNAIEYAVEMREFPQESLLPNVLDRGELVPTHIDALAQTIANFHADAGRASAGSTHGSPETILAYALANFTEARSFAHEDGQDALLDELEHWTRREHALRHAAFVLRQQAGFVRECHGDLHLGNMVLVDGSVRVFDCIEFNDELRWIDVMSEIAFTVMDLADRHRRDLATRMLNGYLEHTGDYAGLAVLRFYLVYRAMVRAKVAALRAGQLASGAGRAAFRTEFRAYLQLALDYASHAQPGVLITHGLSGSGKTSYSESLLEHIDAVRVRSDVERKRMHGLAALARTGTSVGEALYSTDTTRRTYQRLLELADRIVDGGFTALVDATFLERWQRDRFRRFALERGLPFGIVSFRAPAAVLRARIARRSRTRTDASEATLAVLRQQLLVAKPLGPEEVPHAVIVDATATPLHAQRLLDWHQRVIAMLAARQNDRPHDQRHIAGHPRFDAKVRFLSSPQSYSPHASRVETIETHLSMVFLTDREAWKLKKPIHHALLDLRDVDARRRNCIEEVRLNRRLAPEVYLGTTALTRESGGALALNGVGEVVDWLVHMRRLPADRMLDQVIRRGELRTGDIESVVDQLCAFYAKACAQPLPGIEYRRRIGEDIASGCAELRHPRYGLPRDLVERICARQIAVLARTDMFDARATGGHIVEGHGDLRPEHICLEHPPQIIDCLEFSLELRTLDTVDELAFLALECERLGAAYLGEAIFTRYRERTGDAPPAALVHFHQSHRATIRARLAIRHLSDREVSARRDWRAIAVEYLALAHDHIEACD
ncbi:MAG TPA: AAA family ATPase [Casimicrobiaceae bacterium]|nr:AAA family ATPase [Casimicrobiaceae bacterium]